MLPRRIGVGPIPRPAVAPAVVDKLLSFRWLCEHCWQIYPKTGPSKSFIFNNCQQILEYEFAKQRSLGLPMRGKALKPRQTGISTYASASLLQQTMTNVGFSGFSIADKKELPSEWIHRDHRWLSQIPDGPEVKGQVGLEIRFPALDSMLKIGSAEGKTPGMGFTIDGAHISEIAKWLHPFDILDDLMPAVESAQWVFIESTGEAVGDYWYSSWWTSRRGEDGYFAVFLPVFIHQEYQADAADLGELTAREDEIVAAGLAWAQECPEHAKLVNFAGVSRQHLAWRRLAVMGEPYHGDDEAFSCKYPSTIKEAFMSMGSAIFDDRYTTLARKTIRPHKWRGNLVMEKRTDPTKSKFEESKGGRMLVWEWPEKGLHYAIGADCQWGKGRGADADPDYDACFVECVETRRICAKIRGRMDMYDWAVQLAALGYQYNEALLAPERNAQAAKGVIDVLLGIVSDWKYPHLWVRLDLKAYGAIQPKDYGWYTDEHSKPRLVIDVKARMLSPFGMDWADKLVVEQMEAYRTHPSTGKWEAPDGQHDDDLMARMITSRASVDYMKELAAHPPEPVYGELTDFQHRVVEHLEKYEEIDKRETAELEGVNEW